jgi:hypothetical protein
MDRRRFFEIARGSALECAAIQDCLHACALIDSDLNDHGKEMLHRIVSMLTKLAAHRHELREDTAVYGNRDYDDEHDNDNEIGL